MLRSISTIALIISTTWLLSACAGKKTAPSDTSESDLSGSTPPGATSETDTGGLGGSSGGLDSGSLPVVYFGFNEYTINSEDREKLARAAEGLKSSGAKITIEGHCDERGSNEYNLALGEKRAQSIKGYLQKMGVSSASLSAISYGEERPADSSHSEGAWGRNRRGEIVVNR